MNPSERFFEALSFAAEAHAGAVRKGTDVPYLSHLIQVAGLVMELGGDEDEAIGALLHDAAEDAGGEAALSEILTRFGPRVESIVRQNSDSITDEKAQKGPWRERKERYIAGIARKEPSALLVSIADKIHNARSLSQDNRFLGDAHWKRFNASKEDSLWYYRSLLAAFEQRTGDDPRLGAAVALLRHEVTELGST